MNINMAKQSNNIMSYIVLKVITNLNKKPNYNIRRKEEKGKGREKNINRQDCVKKSKFDVHFMLIFSFLRDVRNFSIRAHCTFDVYLATG